MLGPIPDSHLHIGRPEGRRVVGDRGARKLNIAQHTLDREPALAHRGEMAAARDERDVVPALRELRAEISADTSGSHHCDAHRAVSSPQYRSVIRRKSFQ